MPSPLECVRQKVDCRIWLVPPMEAFTDSGLSSQVVNEIQEIIPAIIPATDMTPASQDEGTDLTKRSTLESQKVIRWWQIGWLTSTRSLSE